ncbi:MAG: hypothetical protein FWH20_08160 [Oscillospiraceae bacterium]|nr:hypothetical protein [Oscillospiraceae bacterium]
MCGFWERRRAVLSAGFAAFETYELAKMQCGFHSLSVRGCETCAAFGNAAAPHYQRTYATLRGHLELGNISTESGKMKLFNNSFVRWTREKI